MSETEDSRASSPVIPERGPKRRTKRGPGRDRNGARLMIVLAVIISLLLVMALALYVARREAARQILIGWLERRGVEADIEIERLELDGLTARIRVGGADDPDFTVERAEMDYAVGLPWSRTGLGVTPSRIRLIRPVLRASWRDGVFSLGSLDPLLDEFRGRPPGPEARGRLVLIEQGRLNLTTDYGPLNVLAEGRVEDGRLMRLSARAGQAALVSGETRADLHSARLELNTAAERTEIELETAFAALASPGLSGEDVVVRVRGAAPYPDLQARRSSGPVAMNVTLSASNLQAGSVSGQGLAGELTLDGRLDGWLETFHLAAESSVEMTARALTSPNAETTAAQINFSETRLDLARNDDALRWRLEGPAALTAGTVRSGDLMLDAADLRTAGLSAGGRSGGGRATAFEASAPVTLAARRMTFGDLNLAGINGRLDTDMISDGVVRMEAGGRLTADRGAWPLLGAPAADDFEEMAALKRALGAFRLEAPSFRLIAGSGGTQVALGQAVRITPLNGGLITVAASPDAPLFSSRSGGGAAILNAQAPDTDVQVDVGSWRLTPGGFTAALDGAARFNFGFARGVNMEAAGALTSSGGRLTFQPQDCVSVRADQLDFGENDARALSGALCPPGAPLLTVAGGGWTAQGLLRDVQAEVGFLEARFSDVAGSVTVRGAPAGLSLDADIAQAQVHDASQPQRFLPLSATGQAGLSNDVWSGLFSVSRGPHRLGTVDLRHDGRAEVGGVRFDASNLIFSEDGLQPEDVTPLTDGFIEEPVEGRAGVAGHFDWSPEGASSEGLLTIERLNFTSPVGPVTGLSGEIAFTSLAPLITAPEQRLTAEGLAAFTPLANLDLLFELGAESFQVSGVDLDVAGGHVTIEPFDVPLDRTQPFAGTVVFRDVQLGDLIGGAGFGEQVALNAVVSGRVPFTWEQDVGFRVVDGSLHAVQPGRLEIEREALSGLEAGGGGEGVPPNVVQDLAYQAMEDLAFDLLTAQVNSLDEGRLGVLFRIRGRHDPPQRQELRLTLRELLNQSFLNRELPLPSGTEIDLTLDTTLNLNQLLSDLLALDRARRGEKDENSADE